jgi:hypothetical protein
MRKVFVFLSELLLREEEKSVKEFLFRMVTRPATCSMKSIVHVARTIILHAKAITITMIGFGTFWIVAGCLAHEHPGLAVLLSLLSEFAELISLSVTLFIFSLLFTFLIFKAEKWLAAESDRVVPEPHLKTKWHRVTYFPPELFTYCVSLKEHSPPAFSS